MFSLGFPGVVLVSLVFNVCYASFNVSILMTAEKYKNAMMCSLPHEKMKSAAVDALMIRSRRSGPLVDAVAPRNIEELSRVELDQVGLSCETTATVMVPMT